MHRTVAAGVVLGLVAGLAVVAEARQELVAAQAATPPVVDGGAGDPAWAAAAPLVTRDPLAGIEIVLRATHHEGTLYLLAQFPDPAPDREHKTLVWDTAKGGYGTGSTREDTLVLKWSMEPLPVDLTLTGEDSYQADVWYWKAHRTDPVGYADDKVQIYTDTPRPGAQQLLSAAGRPFYLSRSGDAGRAAYAVRAPVAYEGDTSPKYDLAAPAGSRADVRARGEWTDGRWTVEFARPLLTGHPDDVQFEPPLTYQFGVSRFEVAGRPREPGIDEPLFGAGDVSEELWLRFH